MSATKFTLLLEGEPYEIERRGELLLVNGVEFAFARKDDQIVVSGIPHTVKLQPGGAEVDGIAYGVETKGLEETKAHARKAESHAPGETSGAVTAVMPGLVIQLLKAKGDAVAEGETVVLLEAMKMQNELKARKAGRVARIDVKEGETVEVGQVLCVIE